MRADEGAARTIDRRSVADKPEWWRKAYGGKAGNRAEGVPDPYGPIPVDPKLIEARKQRERERQRVKEDIRATMREYDGWATLKVEEKEKGP